MNMPGAACAARHHQLCGALEPQLELNGCLAPSAEEEAKKYLYGLVVRPQLGQVGGARPVPGSSSAVQHMGHLALLCLPALQEGKVAGGWHCNVTARPSQVDAPLTTWDVAAPAAEVPQEHAPGAGGIPFSSSSIPGGTADMVHFTFTTAAKQVGARSGNSSGICQRAAAACRRMLRRPALAAASACVPIVCSAPLPSPPHPPPQSRNLFGESGVSTPAAMLPELKRMGVQVTVSRTRPQLYRALLRHSLGSPQPGAGPAAAVEQLGGCEAEQLQAWGAAACHAGGKMVCGYSPVADRRDAVDFWCEVAGVKKKYPVRGSGGAGRASRSPLACWCSGWCARCLCPPCIVPRPTESPPLLPGAPCFVAAEVHRC